MGQPGVLICDLERRLGATLAAGFERLGWDVQSTHDDAVAGYRLLMWCEPEELPQVAVFVWDDPNDLLEFCRVLKGHEVLDHVGLIVINEPDPKTAPALQSLGALVVRRSEDPWLEVKAALDRIAETRSADWPGVAPANQRLRADLPSAINHQHADQTASAMPQISSRQETTISCGERPAC